MRSALEAIEGGACREAEWREDGLLYTDGSSRFLAPVEGRRAFVEIQALFFNAFKVMEFVETHFRRGQRAHACHESAKRVQRAFNELMWSGEHHVGVDSLHEGGADLTPRPMSLLAVSLSHPVLVRRRWDLLLDTVEGALLTPLGLRGKPFDVGAKAYFPGDSFEDARRHGGIWPQFLGAYLVAYAKTFGRSDEGIAKIESHLEPLQRAAETGMLNHLPEFFDSAEPFTQRGAPADAAASGQLIWALTAKIETYHFGGEEE
jgi:glycogen debranching enzyme